MALDAENMQQVKSMRPVKLNRLDAHALLMRHCLCSDAALPDIAVQDQRLVVAFHPNPTPKKDGVVLRATINGHFVAVRTDWSQLRRAIKDNLELLNFADAALVIEDRLAPWLDAFEHATGLSLKLDALCEIGKLEAMPRMGASLMISDTRPVPLEFWGSAEALAALHSAMTPRNHANADTLAVSLSLSIFSQVWPMSRLKELTPGAGIYLGAQSAEATLIVQNQFEAMVQRDGPKLTFASDFKPVAPIGDIAMQDADASTHSEDFDTLQVRVQVRAGEALISLADLRKIAAGTVISLPGYDGGQVDLLVNEQRIGRGNLVEVPGGRAVEVTELFSNG